MAIFGRKKGDGGASTNGDGGKSGGGGDAPPPGEMPQFQPDKAQRFFEHAKTVGETGNHEYAMQMWLSGLKQDASSMYGLQSFLNSAVNFTGKPGKDLLKSVEGKTDADKFTQAVLAWGLKIGEGGLAVKAVQAAAKLDLAEQTYYLGEQALKLVGNKPKKDQFVKLMDAFSKVQAFDLAVKAGDAAVNLDPADGQLANEVKNMSAQSTMSRGGFDKTGQEGGFRENIRDADKQRELEEAERIVKSEETVDRLIAESEAELQKRPDDVPTMQKLSKRLLDRGRPEDEDRSIRLLKKAYDLTDQFRFRQDAGKIRIRQLRRTLKQYEERAKANPDDPKAQAAYEQALNKFTDIEIGEFKASVEHYPTDLTLKYELGRRYYQKKNYDEAIALLQEAKNDARFKAQALSYLAESFRAMEWNDEAIATYRQAVDSKLALSDELRLDLRYGLMNALAAKAESEEHLESAEEAEKIASEIAIEHFGFKDIREKREQLKQLKLKLKDA